MATKKLPVSIHTFATMIEKNHLYVDKTAYIYKMLDEVSIDMPKLQQILTKYDLTKKWERFSDVG